MLLFMLDVHGYSDQKHTSQGAAHDLRVLVEELRSYAPDWLETRPALICVNKMDTPDAEPALKQFEASFADLVKDGTLPNIPVLAISAQNGDNLVKLVRKLRHMVDDAARQTETDRTEFVEHMEFIEEGYVPQSMLDAWKGTTTQRHRTGPRSKERTFDEFLHGADADVVSHYREETRQRTR